MSKPKSTKSEEKSSWLNSTVIVALIAGLLPLLAYVVKGYLADRARHEEARRAEAAKLGIVNVTYAEYGYGSHACDDKVILAVVRANCPNVNICKIEIDDPLCRGALSGVPNKYFLVKWECGDNILRSKDGRSGEVTLSCEDVKPMPSATASQ